MQNEETKRQIISVSVNDADIYCETHGGGEPLLLLHGFNGAGSNWDLVFTEYPVGYRLIIPDIRGHGHSTNPSGTFTHRQAAADIFALMDKLEIDRIKTVGLSCGGNVLLHMSTQQPDRIEAMIIVSATPYYPEQCRVFMRQISADNRSDADWAQMLEWHKNGDEQIRSLWRQGNAMADSYDDMNFTPSYLSTIKAKTLIVHGDHDPLYPINIATEMFTAIPNSSLWVVPNGGHGPIFGKFRNQFTETALEFLSVN